MDRFYEIRWASRRLGAVLNFVSSYANLLWTQLFNKTRGFLTLTCSLRTRLAYRLMIFFVVYPFNLRIRFKILRGKWSHSLHLNWFLQTIANRCIESMIRVGFKLTLYKLMYVWNVRIHQIRSVYYSVTCGRF